MADPSRVSIPKFDIEPSEVLIIRVQRGGGGMMLWVVVLEREGARATGTITSETLESALIPMEQYFMLMLRQKINTLLNTNKER